MTSQSQISLQDKPINCNVRSNIHRAILRLKTQFSVIPTDSLSKMRYKIALKQKRSIPIQLFTLWTFESGMNFSIKIELLDENQNFLQGQSPVSVSDLVNKLNRESILGTYFTGQNNHKLLIFRHSVRWSTLKGQIGALIQELFWQTSQEFAKYIQKLNMVNTQQKCKSGKVHLALVKLRHLKELFEYNRRRRDKSLNCYNLNNCSMKIVDDVIAVIGYRFNLLNQMRNGSGSFGAQRLNKCNKVYEKVQQQYKPKKEKISVNTEIARGIEINKVISEKFFCEGGFSKIYRGEYIVNFYPTINPHLLPLQENKKAHHSQVKQLVKKTIKKQEQTDSSFQNQLNFLRYIRNQKYQRISRYYIPTFVEKKNNIMNEQLNYIFMEYYQNNLHQASKNWLSNQTRLNVALQLFESIAFLVYKNILHRDLKQLNILVDSQNNIKLIDFGSTCGIFKQNPEPGAYTAIDNDLMATQGYYFPYSHLSSKHAMIAKKFTKEQYYQSDTFDLYSAGTILKGLFNLNNQNYDSMVHNQLMYLAQKCQQKSPEDRLKAHEAELYIFMINQLFKEQRTLEAKQTPKPPGETDLTPLDEFVRD